MKIPALLLSFLVVSTVLAQSSGSRVAAPAGPPPVVVFDENRANQSEIVGMKVRVKDITRFRGVRGNQLLGYGLVVGLEGTGDTKKTPFTATLLSNALKRFGTMMEPGQLDSKNIATVAITAELPPFATPGNTIDITVTSIGDAKSLQGGYLLQAPLFGANDDQNAVAVAQGPVSVGGFNVQGGAGGSVQKNHVNVGRLVAGGIVERSVPFQFVFGQNLFVELDEGDLTTALRVANAIRLADPAFDPEAIDGGTVRVRLPQGMSPVQALSQIESLEVMVDSEGLVVINERTGTIVIGGNVRLGPAVIAQGSLRVVIEAVNYVSQPTAFSTGGSTALETNESIRATEETKLSVVGPAATISDLARIFQALKVTPRDMIAILQALKEQGALRARIRVQ